MESVEAKPAATYSTGIRTFVNVLAIVHAVGFASIWFQAAGLFGAVGILPAARFLHFAAEQLGRRAWYEFPSLCWIIGAGRSIDVMCAAGIVLSAVLLFGYARPVCLLLLWALYLSLSAAGQEFFSFQWDILLLESTLIAIFLVPWTFSPGALPFDPPKLARFLVWWLLARLMFLSGAVKLNSHDPAWLHLTALTFHYQTQPLPTPVAWYAAKLPLWFQQTSCLIMFAIELGGPLCLVAPRRVRNAAALAMAAFQIVIAVTGNYAFFNLLSFGLCLTAIDDQFWKALLRRPAVADPVVAYHGANRSLLRWFGALSVGITFLFEFVPTVFPPVAEVPYVQMAYSLIEPLRSFNTYGLFRVMTTERPELIFEGSDDGRTWQAYELPFKPGDLSRAPPWVAPYQPRLDWQLWFAALGPPQSNSWVKAVCGHLLRGDRSVLGLFSRNPFPGHPPRQVRVVRYIYEFTSWAERKKTGDWWKRSPVDFYIPPVSLTASSP